jgi:hypothetical protein
VKRTPELTPLSHDHHKALFVAQRLRRADDEAAAAAELLDYWLTHGRRHFEIEEGVLLPAWLELDPAAQPALAARLAAEHLSIRTFVRRAGAGGLDLAGLAEAGRLLAEHVRFEERELFPLIERGLEPTALAALGVEIAAAEAS